MIGGEPKEGRRGRALGALGVAVLLMAALGAVWTVGQRRGRPARVAYAAVEGPVERLVIIGGGPAAYTAAIYAGRADMAPMVFEGTEAEAGGQLTTTTEVENFPGFPEGIQGPELVEGCRGQAARFGAQLVGAHVDAVDLRQRPFRVESAGRTVWADALIVATGATARRLALPGAGAAPDGFWQRGVSACAVCDGALPIFRGRVLVVVGGGDSAMEEALFLARYASTVHVVHRRAELRASRIMAERARAHPRIAFLLAHEPVAVRGDTLMRALVVRDLATGVEREIEAAGLFFAIGHEPSTAFLAGQRRLDAQGYIATVPGSTETSVPGVFAAGDVQDRRYRQAITAAGSGCMAALDAEHFLSAQQHVDL